MTGMEHAIEQAIEVLDAVDRNHDLDSGDLASSEEYARALHEAGLLAPAPLREEWGGEMRDVRLDRDPYVLHALGPDNAQWQIEHNPTVTTGRIMHRYTTGWFPADAVVRAEGDGGAVTHE